MSGQPIARHKTALVRGSLSRPLAIASADGLLKPGRTIFDYGCGRGDDLRHLRQLGYEAEGWDPAHRPHTERLPADIVNLGYVVNVIEHRAERDAVLRSAWELTRSLLVVSARMTWDARDLSGRPLGDGLVTRNGTFQKFFTQPELADWVETTLEVRPLAAAPGIFYVFRDPAEAQNFLATRVYTYRPRLTINPQERYDAHRETLQPLFDFMRDHARPPRPAELPAETVVAISDAVGGLARAERLIRQVTEDAYWDRVAQQRRSELLVYVALSRFGGRPRFSQLGATLAADIRWLFGTYRNICEQSDRLLALCGDQTMIYVNGRGSRVGKQTPTALYLHRSAIPRVAPVLQVYEGCARVLAGTLQTSNVIKLSLLEPRVSYLTYPNFDRDPHPTLASAAIVHLGTLTIDWRDYSRSENPPLLHRKEEFLDADHARRALYERLTRAEMRAGLYEHPERIGTLKGWQATLDACVARLQGHRLYLSPGEVERRSGGSGQPSA